MHTKKIFASICFLTLILAVLCSCEKQQKITSLEQLRQGLFAVPNGTVADKLVLSKLPEARFIYFNSVLDAAMAVKAGKAEAVAYDEPILRNISAKTGGLQILDEMITTDSYGFAVNKAKPELKQAIDQVIAQLRSDGTYADMHARWLPESGAPAPMPQFEASTNGGVLRLGTAAVTEPFSFVAQGHEVVGFDIELAQHVARHLGKKLEVVNLEFGSLIPALMAGKVDMIAACITITEERARKVLFSEPYYKGGIAAMVKR